MKACGGMTGVALLFSLLVMAAGAEPICLELSSGSRRTAYRVNQDDRLRLSFRHSLYGSLVEEHFRIMRDGFQLFEARYAELRLAEFYGHELATFDNGSWVVHAAAPVLPAIDFRVSADSSFVLHIRGRRLPLEYDHLSAGRHSLNLVSCPGTANGR